MRLAIVMTTLVLFVAVFVILISTDWFFPDSFSNTKLDSKTTPEGIVVS